MPQRAPITRLASNEILSPSNKIHREVGRAKDLSAPWYVGISLKVPTDKVEEMTASMTNLLMCAIYVH